MTTADPKSSGTLESEYGEGEGGPRLEYTVEKPLNREPALKELVSSYITGTNGYDRNHGPIPYIDATTHKLTIDGLVKEPRDLSIAQLRDNFRQHSVTCALQCAGNRRHTMRTRLKEVSGIDWFDGAVMNCRWSGPLLCDVLRSVGVASDSSVPNGSSSSDDRPRPRSDLYPDPDSYIKPSNKAHVAFASYQTVCQDDSYYGSSIPLARCMRPSAEIVLALDMNGSPLTAERGFPLRVVAPGIAGARAVKWLDRISVQAGESPNFYQQRDYKILPPEATDAAAAEEWWGRVPAIQDMPVNSVVAVPGRGETVVRRRRRKMKSKGRMKVNDVEERMEEGEEEGWGVGNEHEGKVYVKGYALPAGEDGPVVRVEVSGDGGLTWTDARLITPFSSLSSSTSSSSSSSSPGGKKQSQDPNDDEQQKHHTSKWAWTLWEAYVWMEPGQGRRILSRATDTAGNTQPACPQWNFRGVAYNGYGEVDELTVV